MRQLHAPERPGEQIASKLRAGRRDLELVSAAVARRVPALRAVVRRTTPRALRAAVRMRTLRPLRVVVRRRTRALRAAVRRRIRPLRAVVRRRTRPLRAAIRRPVGRSSQDRQRPVALPPPGTVLELDGVRIRAHEELSEMQVRKLVEGRHTKHERALVIGELQDDDVVMELGGGIGMLSAAIALRIGSERVFSYEPNPELEPLIHDNYRLNGVAPTMKMCMLGREAGTRTLHVSRNFQRSNVYKASELTHPVIVPVEPLNDEIHRIRPTVLIFDVQGAERELLEFADLSGVRLCMVEMHKDMLGPPLVNDLRRKIRRQGLREVRKSGPSILFQRSTSQAKQRSGQG